MQELLFENPITLGSVGLGFTGIAAFVWMQTGHKVAFYSVIALASVTLLLVLVNLQVTTDRERIRRILDDVAAALRNNDHEKIFSYVHPNAVEGLRKVQWEVRRFDFEEARVTGIKEIAVNFATTPPTAIAEFFARVKASGNSMQGTVVRFVRVYFMQRDGRWLVRDYEHFDPTAGFRENAITQPAF